MPVKCVDYKTQLEMVAAFDKGATVVEIADHFGCKNTTTRRVLMEHNKVPPANYHKTKDEIEMLTVLAAQGINNAPPLRVRLTAAAAHRVAPPMLVVSTQGHTPCVPSFQQLKIGDEVLTQAKGWNVITDLQMQDIPLMQLGKSNAVVRFYTEENVPTGYGVSGAVIDWRSNS